MTLEIPELATERLRLRGHRVSDLDAMTAMRNEPAVYRHISGQPSTREDNWRKLMASVGHWHLHGYGYWVLEQKETGALVGEAGFGNFKRDMLSDLDGTLEAGWALASAFHGKGYGREAVEAVLHWAQTQFPDKAITCIIAPENAASIRLAEKLGFIERCRRDYKGEESLVMDFRPPERTL